ncbi:MAG: PAS domain-containing protein [Ferruginibacter sp.]
MRKNNNSVSQSIYTKLKDVLRIVDDELNEKEKERLVQSYVEKLGAIYFPAGPHFTYIFSYTDYSMLYVDDAFEKITGIPKNEVLHIPLYDFFSNFIANEDVYTAARLADIAFEVSKKYNQEDVIINYTFNLYKRDKEKRRMLIQYKNILYTKSGEPYLLAGRFTDITHINPVGPAMLWIIVNNEVICTETGTDEEILLGLNIPLNLKELALLKLKNRGFRTKEIAEYLQMKELSIYSMVRDIKRKTGMDVAPLITVLKEKGLLSTPVSAM